MKVCAVLKGHGFRALYLGVFTSFDSAITSLSEQFNNDGSIEVVDPASLPEVTFLNGEKFHIFFDTIKD